MQVSFVIARKDSLFNKDVPFLQRYSQKYLFLYTEVAVHIFFIILIFDLQKLNNHLFFLI
jgi:hypothetical protein